MGLSAQRTPKIATLVQSGDAAALVEAVTRADGQTARAGRIVDGGAPTREAAILGLAELDHRDATPVVMEALADPSDRVRCAAIRALHEWGEALPLAEAIAWLPAQGASRALALAAVAQLADPKSAPVLATSLVHGVAQPGLWEEEAEVVSSLYRGKGSRGALKRVLEVLLEALDYHDQEVAGRAEDFLLWLGEDAAPALIAAISHRSAPHRSVWILGQIGGAIALGPMIEALEHPDARARAEACVALGELRDPIAVDALFEATHDSEHEVRVKAAAALDRIGTVALLASLTALRSAPAARRRPTPAPDNGSAAGPKTRASVRG
jgi:HEAT repeat protein